MAVASPGSNDPPLSELNTTPLIDVMLVLLVMMILSVPIAINSLEYDLPGGETAPIEPDRIRNTIVITAEDTILYNGSPVSEAGLADVLRREAGMRPEPQLEFRPSGSASYRTSAEVLRLVKASGITNLGFAGNERYRNFGRAD